MLGVEPDAPPPAACWQSIRAFAAAARWRRSTSSAICAIHGAIFLVGKPDRRERAKQKVLEIIEKYQFTVVAIGNGTACRADRGLLRRPDRERPERPGRGLRDRQRGGGQRLFHQPASAARSFPQYDATLRGAISIGRRLQDPLSELVKIEPANIGVGLYQHDVKAKHLRTSLDDVVESCVNYVGVDVNMASPPARYVSGLNQLTARRLYEHRREHGPFRNREQLHEVPGLGEATFVQAAGFLNIPAGDNPLDLTWIHPESYAAAGRGVGTAGRHARRSGGQGDRGALAERIGAVDLAPWPTNCRSAL